MRGPVDIYVAEMARAVLGGQVSQVKIADPARLRRIAEHLVQCEDAHAALRAKGYGRAGSTFLDLVREVAYKPRGILDRIFRPAPRKLSEAELHDIWTTR